MTDFGLSQEECDSRLPLDISAFDRLCRPVWVFDPLAERKLYANPAAIALWGADDLGSLRARDFSSKSKAARTRTEQLFKAVKAGKNRSEIWTFYPNDAPVTVRVVSSHLALRDGTSAILFEAVRLDEADTEPLRALEIVRHTATPVSLFTSGGDLLFANPSAIRAYETRATFKEKCRDQDAACAAWTAGKKGGFTGRLWMHVDSGMICHKVTLQRTIDPITGAMAILSTEADDTASIESEAYLAEQMSALEMATANAEDANRAKSVFLANMSHEIRTPLNGVVGLADILCKSNLSGLQREAAELIRSSGRSLEQLLADILQLAQIEAGEVPIVPKPFNVADVAKDVTDLLRLKAEANGSTLALHVAMPSGEGRVGDALRLRQVLTNLVSNAVKFTNKGATSVVVEDHGAGIRVSVTDTGIGFDEEQKARIFERFQQADGSITRRFGGSGLGLAITASLVERMGGELGCQSTVGTGSTFWVELPFIVADMAKPIAVAALDENSLQGLKVLVADDHPVNRRVLEMILEPFGVDVVSVENGAEAIQAALDKPFDVVLMDMQMPIMDGLEATRAIVAAEGPPVVMVSANGLSEHVKAAMEAGAVAFVTKPIQPAVLIETVIATTENDAASPLSKRKPLSA